MPLHFPRRVNIDVLVFSIIVTKARKPDTRILGIPSLLDTILRDATVYFVFIIACQLFPLSFLIFAPVSGTYCVRVG